VHHVIDGAQNKVNIGISAQYDRRFIQQSQCKVESIAARKTGLE